MKTGPGESSLGTRRECSLLADSRPRKLRKPVTLITGPAVADVLMIRNQAAHYHALVPADYVALKAAVNEIGNALDAFLLSSPRSACDNSRCRGAE